MKAAWYHTYTSGRSRKQSRGGS